jgi:hypothetical protein
MQWWLLVSLEHHCHWLTLCLGLHELLMLWRALCSINAWCWLRLVCSHRGGHPAAAHGSKLSPDCSPECRQLLGLLQQGV